MCIYYCVIENSDKDFSDAHYSEKETFNKSEEFTQDEDGSSHHHKEQKWTYKKSSGQWIASGYMDTHKRTHKALCWFVIGFILVIAGIACILAWFFLNDHCFLEEGQVRVPPCHPPHHLSHSLSSYHSLSGVV